VANCANQHRRGLQGNGTDADAFADFGQMLFMASILTTAMTQAAPVPRAGQMAPNR